MAHSLCEFWGGVGESALRDLMIPSQTGESPSVVERFSSSNCWAGGDS